MSEIGAIDESTEASQEPQMPLELQQWVAPEPTKANERKLADLRAGNQRAMQRLVARKAAPHPVAVLAARIKALLAIAPDGGESLAAAEEIDNPLQVLTNAVEGICIMQVGGHPGLRQAFDVAFEEQMKALLETVESKVNQAMLQAGMPGPVPGAPEVRSKGGLILPSS